MKIEIKKLQKTYLVRKSIFKFFEVKAINDINLTIDQGEIVGIIGTSLSGKTTLAKLICGNEKPTSGEIYPATQELKKHVSNIENYASKKELENETVYNALHKLGKKNGLETLEIEKAITDIRDIISSSNIMNKEIKALNDLEKMKFNLSVSLLSEPNVIVLDGELFDIKSEDKTAFLKTLKLINKELKTTIVMTSNNLTNIEKICKRIVLLKEGKIVLDDEYEKIKNNVFSKKNVIIYFNKTFNLPKGNFDIIESSEYSLNVQIDFNKCDFASLINQFDINTIIDINISSIPLDNIL